MAKRKAVRVIPEGLSAYEWASRQLPALAIDPGDLNNWVVANVKPGASDFYAWRDGSRELPPKHLTTYLNARAGGYKTDGRSKVDSAPDASRVKDARRKVR